MTRQAIRILGIDPGLRRTGWGVVEVDGNRLSPALRYEASRGGMMFPHLYAALPLDAVLWARPLPVGADGLHRFPDLPP